MKIPRTHFFFQINWKFSIALTCLRFFGLTLRMLGWFTQQRLKSAINENLSTERVKYQ